MTSLYDMIESEGLETAIQDIKNQTVTLQKRIRERLDSEFENPPSDNAHEDIRERWGKKLRLLSEVDIQARVIEERCNKALIFLSLIEEL